MATLKTTAPATWATDTVTINAPVNLWDKFTAFAESQKHRKTLWFFIALIVQGVFFLPLPAFLVYYYGASAGILLVTMVCFFTTIIAYMGGAGIRPVIMLTLLSILIQTIMAIAVISL